MEPTGSSNKTTPKSKGQLNFQNAMQDFKSMFPGMDADVIEAVLRSNDGLVDVTVDQLISMSTADATDGAAPRASPGPSASRRWRPPLLLPLPDDFLRVEPPAAVERLLLQPLGGDESPPASASAPADTASGRPESGSSWLSWLWSLLCCLPSPVTLLKEAYVRWYDARARRRFLRRQRRWQEDCAAMAAAEAERGHLVPGDGRMSEGPGADDGDMRSPTGGAPGGGPLNSAGLQERLAENRRQLAALGSQPDPELAQYLEDERVALMLQNDEFMDELRRNREFMDALDVESLDEPGRPAAGGDGPPFTKYPDDEAFRERLKHMGKASRKKFSQLARLFHFNRRGGARHLLAPGAAPSGDQLLLVEDPLTEEDLNSEPSSSPAPPFVDRHSVQTSSPGGRNRTGGDQMV
ncbi:CUE domain-containing protein 1 [Amphibalanus amphitrite]|uniref:CUE domain-containing protein 1 n=1 Tax=Amphibalanus amphitrite TaxID=1232801 RepID=A0A6A4W4R6_AMPAM|nr:CUE domain-containing protein 1 [Amphibalanus amphitrite]